jgi:hypothetical protein
MQDLRSEEKIGAGRINRNILITEIFLSAAVSQTRSSCMYLTQTDHRRMSITTSWAGKNWLPHDLISLYACYFSSFHLVFPFCLKRYFLRPMSLVFGIFLALIYSKLFWVFAEFPKMTGWLYIPHNFLVFFHWKLRTADFQTHQMNFAHYALSLWPIMMSEVAAAGVTALWMALVH